MSAAIARMSRAPAVQAAAAWLDVRSRREQRLIAGLAILAGVAVFWYAIAQPILRMRESATVRIETAAQLNARLDAAASGPVAPTQAPVSGEMADILRQRAMALGLSPQRIEPEPNGAEIAIDSARYDAVVRFIDVVEGTDGGVIQDLRIEQGTGPGMVQLQMRVSRP